ncbi:MAG: sigma-70 family RNA polymerase sigma factor [Acidobacteriota bacterium]
MRECDRYLAARMLGGDERAFSEFFDWHFPRLFRFALVRLGNDEAAAEDVVQATLCRAVNRLATYRGEATLFTWLCVICRHEISDYLARNGRVLSTDLADDNPEIRGALESLAAAGPDTPERAAERAELSRLVHAILDALPGHYAHALEWKYMLGLSVEEIGQRLGIGHKAAESVLSRAREAFRLEFSAVSGGAGTSEA